MTVQNLARGRLLAHGIIARTAPKARLVERSRGRKASLAIVAGADVQSQRFVQIKQRLLGPTHIQIEPVWLPATATTQDVLGVLADLNARADLDAIFLQFPLPDGIDPQAVSDAIVPEKDIDCSGAIAEARFQQGESAFIPVAPQAACQLLEDTLGSLTGRRIVIYGAEDVFARALRTLLQRAKADVEITTASMPDADALVVVETLPPAESFLQGGILPVLLDAGYYLPPRPGDWPGHEARERIGVMLKQYGNVGPLTVANLARSTVAAASQAPASRAGRPPRTRS